MKKFMTDIKTLAALLMAGAAFTACSSDDSIIDEQPVNPAKQTYTLTVKASKGGDATTRALTLTGEGNKTLKAYWDGTETVTVKEGDTPLGTLTVTPDATDNTQATLSGELDAAPSGTALTLELFSDAYNGQNGTLDYIASHCDYATATTTVTYDAVNKTVTGTDADFTNQQAIIKFMLKDKANDAAINPSALTVTDGTSTVELTSIPAATYTANGEGVLFVAFPAAGSAKTITLTATVGDDTYTYETASAKTFTNGQYYDITVKMTKQAPASPYASLTAEDVGKIIGANGNVYANAAAAEADGTTALALIAYVGDAGTADASSATYKGLALALTDASTSAQWCSQIVATCLTTQYDNETAVKGDMEGIANTNALVAHGSHTHAAASAARNYNSCTHPTGTSAWFLPSAGQWDKMITAAGDHTILASNAGLQLKDYWSSTERAARNVWRYNFLSGYFSINQKTSYYYVRAALAF